MAIHPKVKATTSSSAAVTVIAAVLAAFGVTSVPVAVIAAVVTIVQFVAGYLKSAHVV